MPNKQSWENVSILIDSFKIGGALDNRNVYSLTYNAQTIAFGQLEFI